MLALRILAFAAGVAVIVSFFLSVIRVSLLVRHRQDWLANLVVRVVDRLFRLGLGSTRSFVARDRVLVYEAPVIVIVLIATWFGYVILGFTAIFWAIDTDSLLQAFIISGFSLSTLGSVTGTTDIGKVTAIAEGGVGLGIVALLIAFLPQFYAVIAQREEMVAQLAVRAGPVPSGTSVIEWFHRSGQLAQLTEVWASWERWFEDLAVTHSSLSILIYFRSFRPGRSWITTAGAVADAAALMASTLDVPREPALDLVLRISSSALRRIATSADIPLPEPAPPIDRVSVARAAYDTAYDRLKQAGVPLRADRDGAWHDFALLRARYDAALVGLTRQLEAPPIPWPRV